MFLWRSDTDKDVLWVWPVLAWVGKVTRPNLTSHSTSFSVPLHNYFGVANNNQKTMERNCLEMHLDLSTLASFSPFAAVAMEGPTGHLMSYWCLFSVSEADDSG